MKNTMERATEGGRYFVGDDGSFGCLHRGNEGRNRSERVEFEHCESQSVSRSESSVPGH